MPPEPSYLAGRYDEIENEINNLDNQPRICVTRYLINSCFSGSELRRALLKFLPTCTIAVLATAQITHNYFAPSALLKP